MVEVERVVRGWENERKRKGRWRWRRGRRRSEKAEGKGGESMLGRECGGLGLLGCRMGRWRGREDRGGGGGLARSVKRELGGGFVWRLGVRVMDIERWR